MQKKWIRVRKNKCIEEFLKGEVVGVAPSNIIIGGVLNSEPLEIKSKDKKYLTKYFMQECKKITEIYCNDRVGTYLAYYVKR